MTIIRLIIISPASKAIRFCLTKIGTPLICGFAATALIDATAFAQGTSVEAIPPGEAREIAEATDIITQLQQIRADKVEHQGGKILRGVHAKSHGCVAATFEVAPDLPESYRVGLLREPGRTYQSIIRFSNAAVLDGSDMTEPLPPHPDPRASGSRGMAIKIEEVEGEMLQSRTDEPNQDFLMINSPGFAFAEVRDYLRSNRVLLESADGSDPSALFLPLQLAGIGLTPEEGETPSVAAKRNELLAVMSDHPAFADWDWGKDLVRVGATFEAIRRMQDRENTVRNPLHATYFGAAPFAFGDDRVMRFEAAPCDAHAQTPFDTINDDTPSRDYLRDAVAETMKNNEDLCFNFIVQVRNRSDESLQIEDATDGWPHDAGERIVAAKILIESPQDVSSADNRERCDAVAFNPFHSLSAHRPLGGINRVRKDVYEASASKRCADLYEGACRVDGAPRH